MSTLPGLLLFSFSQLATGFPENEIVQLLKLHPLSNTEEPCFLATDCDTEVGKCGPTIAVHLDDSANVDSGMKIDTVDFTETDDLSLISQKLDAMFDTSNSLIADNRMYAHTA